MGNLGGGVPPGSPNPYPISDLAEELENPMGSVGL